MGKLYKKTLGTILNLLMIAVLIPTLSFAQGIEPDDNNDIDDSPTATTQTEIKVSDGAEINVKNADILAVVKIFSKKTKRNYILDERVKGKVSIFLPAKVSEDEALHILDALLDLKGLTSVPVGENIWKIVTKKDAGRTTIPTTLEGESKPSAAVITRLLRMQYVNAEDAQKLLSQLISPDGFISAYAGTNSLIIIDSADNISRLDDIIKTIDVPSNDRDVTLIPIKHADAKDIADKLSEILGLGTAKSSSGTGMTSDDPIERIRARIQESAIAGGTKPTDSGANLGKDIIVKARGEAARIIPDERTNSIIVVADEDSTTKIRALVSKLDSTIDIGGLSFFVYRCQHAKADELAEVLSSLAGGSGSRSSSAAGGRDVVGESIGLDGSRNSSRSQQRSSSNSRNNNSRSPGQSRSGSDSRGAPSRAQFGDDVTITADASTNSLIIYASKTEFEKIKELISQLDIKRRQVLVEAMLLEVSLTDNQALSAEFLSSAGGDDGGFLVKNDTGNLADLLSDPSQLSDFSVAAASSGTLTLPRGITIPTQAVLLTAAKRNENVNVLSSPNILTADNEQAEIVVGQNVPFVASRSSDSTNLNNTFNQVERQDVGITLRITPQISSGDFVTLKIFTEVSNIIPGTLGSDLGPTTTVRTSETTVITKHSQMVVIGGLMSDDITNVDQGVPFLSDIPLLGSLFRSTSESRRRTNLLIFITPRIIKDQFDARDTTIESRDTIEGVIEEFGSDPDRSEYLRSKNLDKVTESTGVYEGTKPTTILGELPGSTETPALGSLSNNKITSYKVRPYIAPAEAVQPAQESTTETKTTTATKIENAHVEPTSLSIKPTDDYYTLNFVEQTGVVNPPFKVTRVSGTPLYIKIPKGTKGRFELDKTYGYKTSDGIIKFKVAPNQPTAADIQPPYQLSAYEALNFGKGPWVQVD